MATQVEEQQARDFLKRAEIRTMHKDLLGLREVDALKERDKIASIKTLEEQLDEKKKADESAAAKALAEKVGMEQVLQKNEKQEIVAEKDLKKYANEEERQKIFLMETERFGLNKQVDAIDKEKDPALKLEKNKLLLEKQKIQEKLNAILEQEKKLEGEQKFVAEKSQTTQIPSERKSLEARRWDLDKEIQNVEKKRWEAEKQIEDTDAKVSQIDKSSDQLVTEKNGLRDKILGIDKSLRDIYTVVIAREEEKRAGMAEEQVAQREVWAKAKAEQNEKVQRQQWSASVPRKPGKDDGYLNKAPISVRNKIMESAQKEEEQRKKFLSDVNSWSQRKETAPTVIPAIPTTPQVPQKK